MTGTRLKMGKFNNIRSNTQSIVYSLKKKKINISVDVLHVF